MAVSESVTAFLAAKRDRLHVHTTVGALCATFLFAACSDDGTGPEANTCELETSNVEATVTTGESVRFDWEPTCGIALLLVEEEGSDQWSVNTPEEAWSMPDEANLIHPPVTYGQVPDGSTQEYPAEALVPGQTYELVLWRILPEGSEPLDPPAGSPAGCLATFDNACVVAVHEFTR